MCAWCFAWKGQCHKIFASGFFHESSTPKPLKIWNFVDLPCWKFFIFLLTSTFLKCSNSNFYQTKNFAKQTCSCFLDSFAIKGGDFLKRCLILSVLQICNWRTGSRTKFGDLQFADQSKEICGFPYLKNLRICDCGFSPGKNSCLAPFANLLRGLGETDLWKKPEVENLVALSL